MSKEEQELAILLEAISPAKLRSKFLLPFNGWREDFQPRFLTTDSYDEMLDEAERFTSYMLERYFGIDFPWWPEHARMTAKRLLNSRLGPPPPPHSEAFSAMKICRHCENGGMRMLLDVLAQALLDEAITQYVDFVVFIRVRELTPNQRFKLAGLYQERYDLVPGLELDSPPIIALLFRDVLQNHVRMALYGAG